MNDLGRIDVAGEGDLVDFGMRTHGGAGRFAEAVDDVDHARRKAGLDRQLSHPQGGQRSLFRRLEHDRVSAGQRRRPFAGQDE